MPTRWMARRSRAGDPERAGAQLDAALVQLERRAARQHERLTQARRTLHEAALQAALGRGEPAAAVRHVEALAALEHPAAPTRANVYRERAAALLAEGVEKNSATALAVAVRLLRRRLAHAAPPQPAPDGAMPEVAAGTPAAAPAAQEDWRDIALSLVRGLNQLSLLDTDDAVLHEAGEVAERALAATAREAQPRLWAALHQERSRALGREGTRRGAAAQIDQALAHCRLALQVRRREQLPAEWAESMFLLASLEGRAGALASDTTHLQAAVQAGRECLLELTRERSPLRWARVQSTIGAALGLWARREGSMARRHEAVAASRAALGELSPERSPHEWAAEQCNLGIVLAEIGGQQPGAEGSETLQAAVDAYRAALQVFSRDAAPARRAAVLHNLGGALRLLGERESGTQSLREAALAFAEALQHHTRENAPMHWAAGQNDRALALLAIGRRERRREPVEEAVAALREALQVRRRDAAPLDWATTQTSLAESLVALGELAGEAAAMCGRRRGTFAALEELTPQTLPEHALAAACLAQARAWLEARGQAA
ncbi:MAG: hypothetical protein KIT17_10100 [Rubrivivax sp.]|nr:hypothetical protein [Rubrivivax sp.]